MKVIQVKTVKKQRLGAPLFTGKVVRQSPVTDDEGSDLSIDYVHFPKGVRNKFHKHANDQVLIVTRGNGLVSTKDKVYKVKKGDIIWTPAGEPHYHGAGPNSSFSHISVTRSHTKLTQVHYICTGGCEGVSEQPGTCQAQTCLKYGEPLTECSCIDGRHQEENKKD